MKRNPAVFLFLVIFTACNTINPSRMLKTGSHYAYASFSDTIAIQEYKIATNDELSFTLFTNKGEKIISPFTDDQKKPVEGSIIKYIVNQRGEVKLPVILNFKIAGMTEEQAETALEQKYSEYFQSPFVQIRVINKRVTIFAGGEGGTAKVIPLENRNITLFEALAQAGGINDGKAKKVKLIRGDLKNPKVFLIDLSRIEGVRKADMVLQANDIIYVEPRSRFSQKVLAEIAPYLTVISTLFVVYGIFKR